MRHSNLKCKFSALNNLIYRCFRSVGELLSLGRIIHSARCLKKRPVSSGYLHHFVEPVGLFDEFFSALYSIRLRQLLRTFRVALASLPRSHLQLLSLEILNTHLLILSCLLLSSSAWTVGRPLWWSERQIELLASSRRRRIDRRKYLLDASKKG